MVRRTSIAVQKIHQKHTLEMASKKQKGKCKDLRMISGDIRIGKDYDFKSGGVVEDMSFEKEKTLLELWELYRNGYSTDEVMQRMYIPVIVSENGNSVIATGEKWGVDETILTELRNRYRDIREQEMEMRDQMQLEKYNDLHRANKGLLDVISSRGTSPGAQSRPRSMMSHRDSPNNGSQDAMISKEDESSLLCQCCPCYPNYNSYQSED